MFRFVEIAVDGRPAEPVPQGEVTLSVCEAMSRLYGRVGFVRPWIGYLAVQEGRVVGSASFKSPPENNRVEIAYFTFPGFEGQGIGAEMARRLIEIARVADSAVVITAQTLPEESASTRILRGLGFAHKGTVDHPEDGNVWEWELPPAG